VDATGNLNPLGKPDRINKCVFELVLVYASR
jgi:hypothetical protein